MDTIVDPAQAPLGREPEFVGKDHVTPKNVSAGAKQRYRTEAWRTSRGELVVIVTDNGGTSLMNASEKIAAAIKERWASEGEPVTIIEDWAERPPFSPGRFVESHQNGGHSNIDLAEWKAIGIPLPGA